VAWWHAQQDPLYAMGIDGFKLDFGEQYIPVDPISTAAGPIPKQTYSEEYYRDFFAYGVHRRGAEDFVTMVRPWDESYGFDGRFYAKKEHAPVAWVGDNRRDFLGLADALDHIFRSAAAGYVMLGSDIGGYLNLDDVDVLGPEIPFDQNVFVRWTAVGALSPFMQLHGRANITPWTVPQNVDETVAAYRYWATLHHELVPFFYSLAEEAYAGADPIVRPVGSESEWAGDYRYTLGDALLVAPILDATGVRDVALPAGRYYDWWKPAAAPIDGSQTLAQYAVADPARIPLFVVEGAIIPARVSSALTGLGTAASAGYLTLLVHPASAPSSFVVHDEDGKMTEVSAQGSTITLSRAVDPVILRIRRDAATAAVTANGVALTARADRSAFDAATDGWLEDAAIGAVWVKLPAGESATSVQLQ
jgi:alpha-glucosidase (family GH31 glycosyl hydrolase)